MTAKDIRGFCDTYTAKLLEMDTHEKMATYAIQVQVLALYEIAAQLAELNERIDKLLRREAWKDKR